jgi:hypothetical protein
MGVNPSAMEPQFDITAQLDRWRSGDLLARDALINYLYPVLRAMAGGELRGGRLSMRATGWAAATSWRSPDRHSVG